MLKWLSTHVAPRRAPLRWVLLPMPERLREIAAVAERTPERARTHAAEFSEIITSLWINHVNKRTGRDRLIDTLHAIAAALPQDCRPLRFLDLGASDAISTFDAVSYFRDRLGIPITAHAVDRYTRLHRYDGRLLSEYRTSDGSPVLVRAGRIGLRLGRRLAIPPAEWLRAKYLEAGRIRERLRYALSIPLIHPLAAADPDIIVVEADALAPCPRFDRAFNVVRVSNLLNRSYFSRLQMETILRHAMSYLECGGLLVVSRNEVDERGAAERGTVWRRIPRGLLWISDFNGGSELRHWITRLEARPATSDRAAA